jgi:hypothetical protein
MVSHTRKAPSVPISNLRSESEASHLLRVVAQMPNNHPLGEIEVKSGEQPHMSLGNFKRIDPPEEFAVHIDPAVDPEDIIMQITRLEYDDDYELVLHIANYGDKTACVEVWQL